MKILKLLSYLSIKVREIDAHFLLIATLVIEYLNVKTCLVTLILYCTLAVGQNFLLILEEEKTHQYFDIRCI